MDIIEKSRYIKSKLTDVVYLIDTKSPDFDIIECKIINIPQDDSYICECELPEKFHSTYYGKTSKLQWNDNTKHLRCLRLKEIALNIQDYEFGRNYSNAIYLRKQILSRRMKELYTQLENLTILKTKYGS